MPVFEVVRDPKTRVLSRRPIVRPGAVPTPPTPQAKPAAPDVVQASAILPSPKPVVVEPVVVEPVAVSDESNNDARTDDAPSVGGDPIKVESVFEDDGKIALTVTNLTIEGVTVRRKVGDREGSLRLNPGEVAKRKLRYDDGDTLTVTVVGDDDFRYEALAG